MSNTATATKARPKKKAKGERFLELEKELGKMADRIKVIGEEIAAMQADPKLARQAIRAANSEIPLARQLQFFNPVNI